jgi:hypothetical protein
MCATSLGGSLKQVTTNDQTIKNEIARGMQLLSLQTQLKKIPGIPSFVDWFTKEVNKVAEDMIARRRAETGPVQRDLLQIILDANEEDPVFYPERRVRQEILLFM